MQLLITLAGTSITALVGGLVAFMFWKIERKMDQIEDQSERHNQERIEMSQKERDLLLATADIALIQAKAARGMDVNGDLQDAENMLIFKKRELQDYTRRIAMERMEV